MSSFRYRDDGSRRRRDLEGLGRFSPTSYARALRLLEQLCDADRDGDSLEELLDDARVFLNDTEGWR